MALLSKEQITSADDRKWEDVPVPEWGGTVRLVGMSGTERNAYQSSLVVLGPNGKPQRMNMSDQLAKLVGKCLVDENFERLFANPLYLESFFKYLILLGSCFRHQPC